jgi:hypothetical protein
VSEDAGRPCDVEWSAESLVRPNDQTTHRCRGNLFHDGDHWCGCGCEKPAGSAT